MPYLKKLFDSIREAPVYNSTMMLILLVFPGLLLTVKGSMGVLFVLSLAFSAGFLFRTRKSIRAPRWDKYSISFSLAMASPLIAIFISEAYHGDINSPSYDWASRFLLAIPIFLALRQTNIRVITVLQFGIPLGLLASLIVLERDPFIWDLGRHTTSSAFNLVHFSNTALILGFLSLFSINWESKDHPSLVILKLCGLACGLYISIQSGERGGWIVIPLLFILFVISHNNKNMWPKLIGAILAVITLTWLGYSYSEIMHNRIDAVFSDIDEYAHGNKDTSIGIRLQLYLAALHLFLDHPIFGIGPGEFQQAISSLPFQESLTPAAIRMAASEVHNEILAKCVGTGLFGLLSILSIYMVPFFIFQKSRKTTTSPIRIASIMGICLVTGFFMFGLTVEIFNLKMTATFFAFTIAVLMAAATHQDTPGVQPQKQDT